MNTQPVRWILIVGAGILVGLILLGGAVLILGNTVFRPMFHPMSSPFGLFPDQFESNGERIYFTGRSRSGEVVPEMLGMHQMQPGMMACVNCHGPEGRGGTVTMMMGTFEAPDIRYSTLTEAEHEDDNEAHPAYTEESIKQVITQGFDPAGEPLDWPMPRWRMSERDLDDLVEYLKSL